MHVLPGKYDLASRAAQWTQTKIQRACSSSDEEQKLNESTKKRVIRTSQNLASKTQRTERENLLPQRIHSGNGVKGLKSKHQTKKTDLKAPMAPVPILYKHVYTLALWCPTIV